MEKLGFFSEWLADNMARKGLTSRKLAPKVGCSYEYVRKLVRSENLPSSDLLSRLCAFFERDEQESRKLVAVDRARKQLGPSYWVALGCNPKCEPIYILWPYLTRPEQEYFLKWLRFLGSTKEN